MTDWTDIEDILDPRSEHEAYDPSGDARRCPHHPYVTTSSSDGMFDAPCGECEYAMEQDNPTPEEMLAMGYTLTVEGWIKPPTEDDPVVLRRMGKAIRLSQMPDDDIPF